MNTTANPPTELREAELCNRFRTIFSAVQDPIERCGLEALYDLKSLRHIDCGEDMEWDASHGWTNVDLERPWLVAHYQAHHDAFDVISFGIDTISPTCVTISLFDIFVISPVGMAYTVESSGYAYALEFDFGTRTIRGDIDDLMKDARAAETPIDRVVDRLWHMMSVPGSPSGPYLPPTIPTDRFQPGEVQLAGPSGAARSSRKGSW